FSIVGTPASTGAGVAVKGDGDIVFRPKVAMHLTETTSSTGGSQTVEILAVQGAVYQRSGDPKWSQVAVGAQPSAFSAWSQSTNPRYLGEEKIGGSACWHVAATYGGGRLDLWVRQSDGYPLRARVGQLVVDYGRFNKRVRIG